MKFSIFSWGRKCLEYWSKIKFTCKIFLIITFKNHKSVALFCILTIDKDENVSIKEKFRAFWLSLYRPLTNCTSTYGALWTFCDSMSSQNTWWIHIIVMNQFMDQVFNKYWLVIQRIIIDCILFLHDDYNKLRSSRCWTLFLAWSVIELAKLK